MPQGPAHTAKFFVHSLACTCDPDRIVEDHRRLLFCGECMEPLEKVPARDLPPVDQEEILAMLRVQNEKREK